MNSTSLTETTIDQSRFIPIDILMIFDKTCHTVPMMLVGNTYLSGMVCACTLLSMAVFSLQNDIKQIAYQDPLCPFRGYLLCSAAKVFNCSFLLQALYRYILAIYPNRLFYQSFKFQFFLGSTIWIYGFTYDLVLLFRDELIYDVDNQICELLYHFSFLSIYTMTCFYIIPVSLTILIYIKLVRYVKKMQKNVVVANTLARAKNHLKMLSRSLISVTILIIICFPYTIFILLAFFHHAPKYKFRICFLCVGLSSICVNIALFQFTNPLKSSVRKILQRRRRQNAIAAIVFLI